MNNNVAWITIFFLTWTGVGFFTPSPTGEDEKSNSLFVRFEKLSLQELEETCAQEGLDVTEMKQLVHEAVLPAIPLKLSDTKICSTGGGSAVQMPVVQDAAHAFSLDALIEQQKEFLNPEGFTQWHIASYSSPYIHTIPDPVSPLVTAGGKLSHFLEHKVRGKSIEVIAMVSYMVYRQLAFLYTQHIAEQCARSPLRKKAVPSYSETIIGVLGFNSRALSYTDFLIRVSFCSLRMWLDLSQCIKAFKRYEFLQDPEGYLRTVKFYIERARLLFNDPLYYGTNMSLIKKVLVGLAVPFAWAGIFSQNSPGVPLKNRFFINALDHTVSVVAQESGSSMQHAFEKKIKPTVRDKLFAATGGIVRERLLVDATFWASEYASKRYIHNKKIQLAPFLGRKAGEYAIRHLYLHGLIYFISHAVRNGGLQACGWIGHKIGWFLSKIGFFKENPVDSSTDLLQKQCRALGLLEPGQSLEEVLLYPATIFPGAFARAVRRVITKQVVAPVLAKDPGFVQCLHAMHGVSVYNLLQMMATNFMVPQQMSGRITRIKNAVSPAQWKRILTGFLNELILELFFDRRRMICQVLTESVLAWMSKPVLDSLYKGLLPKLESV